MKNSETLLRNQFLSDNAYRFPIVKKDDIDLTNLALISATHIKKNDSKKNCQKGVHFFIEDYRIEKFYNHPTKYLEKLAQYKFLMTPDYSVYANMSTWCQITSIGKNRWCGAYWQSQGFKVIPTVSWGLAATYNFCFKGIEKGAIVAVSTLGCKHSKYHFLSGYNEMLKQIEPTAIICFDKPFKGMGGNLIVIDYCSTFSTPRKVQGGVYGR